jgi:hypothetical protein
MHDALVMDALRQRLLQVCQSLLEARHDANLFVRIGVPRLGLVAGRPLERLDLALIEGSLAGEARTKINLAGVDLCEGRLYAYKLSPASALLKSVP